uniref:Uncharacterized protein n=1 Tax=Glossina austeni TaxID=7395 RepID=A0A1A9UZG8_GLOAU
MDFEGKLVTHTRGPSYKESVHFVRASYKAQVFVASESHIMIKVPNKQHNCNKILCLHKLLATTPMRVSMSAKPANQTTNQSTSYSTITDSSISVVHLIRRQISFKRNQESERY